MAKRLVLALLLEFKSGTPGVDEFVSLCALGSAVWKKLANAPVKPLYVIGSDV